jgi:hypothetical protein
VRREGKKMVRFRTRFYRNADDALYIQNAGVEIYEIMKDGLNNCIQNAVIEHEGEVR